VAVGALVDAAAVTPVVELLPHPDRSTTASGSAKSALTRVIVAMGPPSKQKPQAAAY
jgi:hypothetical protein